MTLPFELLGHDVCQVTLTIVFNSKVIVRTHTRTHADRVL